MIFKIKLTDMPSIKIISLAAENSFLVINQLHSNNARTVAKRVNLIFEKCFHILMDSFLNFTDIIYIYI